MRTAVIQLRKGPHSGPAREKVQKYMPPAVGSAAAISARDSATTHETVLTIVHDVKAVCGPPVVMTQPNRIGMPETKFIHCI